MKKTIEKILTGNFGVQFVGQDITKLQNKNAIMHLAQEAVYADVTNVSEWCNSFTPREVTVQQALPMAVLPFGVMWLEWDDGILEIEHSGGEVKEQSARCGILAAQSRKHGFKKPEFHVIEVHNPRVQSEPTGKQGSPLLGASIVRGHLKRYTEDSKLMGKAVGVFFWQPHIRGTGPVVQNDYRVHGPTKKHEPDCLITKGEL